MPFYIGDTLLFALEAECLPATTLTLFFLRRLAITRFFTWRLVPPHQEEDKYCHQEQELENLRSRKERLEELERDRDALLESWAELVPARLETLSALERNRVYRMRNLLVLPSRRDTKSAALFVL